ncbi:MAG: hypothetical protein K2M22_07025 [Lachnospiraceae bacterium]|nr:hypothetical protein [Lachnospiraceae bacterium]MDE7176585.1 hypothetical protein [Lachnospiraceae bacterium]
MKNRLIRMTAIIALIAIISSVFLILTRSEIVTDSEVVLTNISLSDTALNAAGTFTSSGNSFRKYVYTIKENSLYITVYGGLVSNKYPNGDFTIDIQDDLHGINTVYLKSGDEETVIFKR